MIPKFYNNVTEDILYSISKKNKLKLIFFLPFCKIYFMLIFNINYDKP